MSGNGTGKLILGISVVAFLGSIAGIVVSALNIKEDVLSTAYTLFEFFPRMYGVIPSKTWDGAIILAVFVSVTQIVSIAVALHNSKSVSLLTKILAGLIYLASMAFDNWTDTVYRSSYLTGDVGKAAIVTVAFYTFGSELVQGLAWLMLFSTWRVAISDIMWGINRFISGVMSIGSEWRNYRRASNNRETKYVSDRNKLVGGESGGGGGGGMRPSMGGGGGGSPRPMPGGGGGNRPPMRPTPGGPPMRHGSPRSISPDLVEKLPEASARFQNLMDGRE